MAITIDTFTANRCLQDGTIDNTGTYLKVVFSFTATGTDTRYSVRMKDVDAGTETAIISGTGSSRTYTSSTAILNSEKSYHVYLIAYDGISVKKESIFIPKTFVLIDFNSSGKGIGIGKISENANALEIGMDMYDRYGSRILNGLAFYESGGSTDPDTTAEELILTSVNTPASGFFFIRTMFYSEKSATAKRTQIAYPYDNSLRSTYIRTYNGAWSAWIEQPVIVEQGNSGSSTIWTYRVYSDGTAECFGKINISSVDVTAALGGWYRSETLYEETSYPYPVTFSSSPVTQMIFQTRNSSAALLWPFSSSLENQRTYLPQCYLIRPVTGTGLNGNINIYVRGKL